MSNLEDGPDLGDAAQVRAEGEREDQEKVMEENARLSRASDVPHVPLTRRIAASIRRAIGASPEPAEPEISDEEVWSRERERRQEYEQDRAQGEGERP